MLVWSALSGLVVGLLAGTAILALVTLIAHVLPVVTERTIDRLRTPVVVLLLLGVPVAGAVLGYLEGRAKLS